MLNTLINQDTLAKTESGRLLLAAIEKMAEDATELLESIDVDALSLDALGDNLTLSNSRVLDVCSVTKNLLFCF